MLIFTSREPEECNNEDMVELSFSTDSARLALKNLERAPEDMATFWTVSQADADLDDVDAMRTWLPLLQKPGPHLVYLQGYNDSPEACFQRCDRLQSKYGLEIVRFSWTSRKHLTDDGIPFDLDLQDELAPFMRARYGLPFPDQPVWLDTEAKETDKPDCAWWLVLARTGNPNRLCA